MSYQVPTHFVQTYADNVKLLLQQKGGRLTASVTQAHFTGKGAKAVEQVGPVTPVKNLGRHSDTPLISTPADARWVFPNDYEWADLIDQQDRLRMIIDPQSAYTQNAITAMRRAQDREILNAFYAAAATGENGTTSTTFPAGQQVGVNVGGTASNLNVAKLRAAKKILMANGVDFDTDMIYAGITSGDMDGLLNEIQVTNLDYNTRPTLVDGRVTSFMGINFIPIEFTDTAAYPTETGMYSGSTRYVPVWTTGGMLLGMWDDVQTRVDQRPDKRYSTQVYAKTTCGATRVEEKRVVQIATIG